MVTSKETGKWVLIVCTMLAVTLGFSQTPTAPVPPKPLPSTAPVVNSDGTVTFSLRAPGATRVFLNWQNMIGRSPAYNSFPMTQDATGVWKITLGPNVPGAMAWINPPAPLAPGYYGYGFNVDGTPPADPATTDINTNKPAVGGVNIPDPANRAIWSGNTSAWSFVFVPGPAADYMADNPTIPHGAWGTVRYFSKLMKTNRQMQVYTPPGYNRDNRAYPVFYLLHGGGGNDTDWIVCMRANYILDNLIAQGKAAPMIMVNPDTNVGARGVSVTQDPFVQELMGSIVPFIEQNYRVAPGTKNRALAGLSMGSNATRDVMLNYPNDFSCLGLYSSGAMGEATITDLVQNHKEFLTNLANSKDVKLIWITEGALEGVAFPSVEANLKATMKLYDEYHIKYTFVPGEKVGTLGGHVWETWSKDLFAFAPLLFK